MIKRLLKNLYKFALFLFFLILAIYITQDLQVFPGVYIAKNTSSGIIPPGVQEGKVVTADYQELNYWRYAPEKPKYLAIIFHGNNDSLEKIFVIQKNLAELGFVTYSFDYRGYGKSTGWPSELGLYFDSEAMFKKAVEEENQLVKNSDDSLKTEKILFLGYSLGAAPASFLAKIVEPKVLLLYAPFYRLKDVVSDFRFLGYLTKLLKYDFPNYRNIAELKKTCVISTHGQKDTLIKSEHTTRLKQQYQGSCSFKEIFSAEADHNGILNATWEEVKASIVEQFPNTP